MRYIAEYQESAQVLKPGASYDWYAPATPAIVSGYIRNLSAVKELLLSFYVEPRGSITVRIPPMSSFRCRNRPAGRVIIQCLDGEPDGVFDFLLSAAQVESSAELPEVLSRSQSEILPLRWDDVPEYIGYRYIQLNSGNSSPIAMARPVGPEIAILDVNPTPVVAGGSIQCDGAMVGRGAFYREGAANWSDYRFSKWGWPLHAVGPLFYSVGDGQGEDRASLYLYADTADGAFDLVVKYFMAPFDPLWADTWVIPS